VILESKGEKGEFKGDTGNTGSKGEQGDTGAQRNTGMKEILELKVKKENLKEILDPKVNRDTGAQGEYRNER